MSNSTEMVERVARAIADMTFASGAAGAETGKPNWLLCVNEARGAIAAMQAPTSQMMVAGAHVHDQRPSEAAATYIAMISAALSPEDEGSQRK